MISIYLRQKQLDLLGRDKNRTPMQWMNSDNAGFSPPSILPWLPVNPNYKMGINVDEQDKQSSSLLNFYRHIPMVRKQTPALQNGHYLPIDQKEPNIISFLRYTSSQKVIVIIHYSNEEKNVILSNFNLVSSKMIFSHPHKSEVHTGNLVVGPYGIIISEIFDPDNESKN